MFRSLLSGCKCQRPLYPLSVKGTIEMWGGRMAMCWEPFYRPLHTLRKGRFKLLAKSKSRSRALFLKIESKSVECMTQVTVAQCPPTPLKHLSLMMSLSPTCNRLFFECHLSMASLLGLQLYSFLKIQNYLPIFISIHF